MEPKVTLLLAKTRGGFLNCNLFKNGGRGTKPTYIFIVIIPLLVIELKATPNGNPNGDFYLEVKHNRPTGGIICTRLREVDFCLQ